ncbi:unnamed protein product [Amoebophrya sp. A120]|nr:unnamed protein product [Amoebophrya sp. A120]|eukprot:GSA120T00002029001.1
MGVVTSERAQPSTRPGDAGTRLLGSGTRQLLQTFLGARDRENPLAFFSTPRGRAYCIRTGCIVLEHRGSQCVFLTAKPQRDLRSPNLIRAMQRNRSDATSAYCSDGRGDKCRV